MLCSVRRWQDELNLHIDQFLIIIKAFFTCHWIYSNSYRKHLGIHQERVLITKNRDYFYQDWNFPSTVDIFSDFQAVISLMMPKRSSQRHMCAVVSILLATCHGCKPKATSRSTSWLPHGIFLHCFEHIFRNIKTIQTTTFVLKIEVEVLKPPSLSTRYKNSLTICALLFNNYGSFRCDFLKLFSNLPSFKGVKI